MPQFREYPEVSNAIANDAILMERIGDGTVYIEFDNLANSVATYVDIANSPAIQNTVQNIFNTANSVLDTANAVLNYAQTNTVVFINGVFANASAQANAIIANASANYGNATAFINGVLAQANAAANAAQTAANTAIDSINYAVANALATANGAIIATYVAQASTYADQANGFAQAAELSAVIAAFCAAVNGKTVGLGAMTGTAGAVDILPVDVPKVVIILVVETSTEGIINSETLNNSFDTLALATAPG